ncbi:hypothetical protein HOLleu_38682 [Holothuria leucospilota]|uniref:Uncharacterized protein n=1 Tax=Holothuria leucospilota TaxID=206669 RepID=A0A9Q1BEA6_HOLLE|nr:hypothetical protein HOLleu_38682 [Holothuria leucospilota]
MLIMFIGDITLLVRIAREARRNFAGKLLPRETLRTDSARAGEKISPTKGPSSPKGSSNPKPRQKQWVTERIPNAKFWARDEKFGVLLKKN